MKLLTINFNKTESVDNYRGVLVPIEEAHRGNKKITSVDDLTNVAHAERADGTSSCNNKDVGHYTFEKLQAEVLAEVRLGGVDSTYELKSIVINKAIQDVGMGTYNWGLFILCGFGWFADSIWLQQLALILPSLSKEFGISENDVRYTVCYLFGGLSIGASFWGVGCDVIGRRVAFNSTLFLAGVFGIAVGASPTWTAVCLLNLFIGFGIGGNIPVDGALFLEFLPNASTRLLTLLSVWWALGQVFSPFVAWGFLGTNFAVDKGWRYFLFTISSLTFFMFVGRFFLFHLYESPKFLLSQNRQAEAVAVVHGLAYKNKVTTWLTEDILNKIGGLPDVAPLSKHTAKQVIRQKLFSFSTDHIKPLFATRQLGTNTALLWFCWLSIGIGCPLFYDFLPQYLSNGQNSSGELVSNYELYRNYTVTSACGVPGAVLAYYAVDLRYFGRKGTLSLSTLASGVLLILFTTSRNSNIQLAYSSGQVFTQTMMFSVLYTYTPEVFPAPSRGTGIGISSLLNRLGGICAPIIAANVPVSDPNIPIYISGVLVLSAFVAMLFLSIETRGRQML